jgi:4-amino-4-deoxy-L-arabinose transferase-like glycosyltransferase
MSIADSQQTRHRFDKLTARLRDLRERAREILPARWLVLLIGIGCLISSQYMMEQRFLQGQPIPAADDWNILYRLEIVNLSNVLAALPYFVVGVILCAWVILPSSWKETFVNWSARWPAWRATRWGKQISTLLVATGLMAYLLVQLGKHQQGYLPVYPFIWIIALVLFTLVIWNFDRDNKVNLSLELNSVDILWLLAILVVGLAIGTYVLNDIPAILIPDEGAFWENARAIALKQFRPVFFDSGVYTFPVASSIYQGWIMRLFGVNLWGWRFSSVLAGVAALVPLYLLGKEWFGRRVAVASAALMLANPYFLSFARLGYNNSQSLLPVTLAVYFWAIGSRKGSYFYLWLAGLTAGLGFYTYSAVWIGLVTLVLGIVYLRLLKQISWKQSFIVLALILLAWGLAFAPRLAYTASGEMKEGLVYKVLETSFFSVFYARTYYADQDLAQTMPLIESDRYPAIFYEPLIYSELLTRGWVRTLLAMFDPHLVGEHFLVSPLAGVITPVFLAIGFFLFLRRWKQSRFGLPLIWFVTGLIFLSIIAAFPPRHTHMVSLIPVIALISGAGLCAVVEALTEYLPARFIPFRAGLLSVLIAVASLVILYSGVKRYFVTMPETYPPSFEDYVSWVAWQTEQPIEIVYIGRSDVPHRVAYLINTRMVPHTYLTVDLNAFSPREHLNSDLPTVLFWETSTKEGLPHLERVPASFSAPVVFRNKDGYVLGYATTNSADISLELRSGFSSGWSSLINTPVWNILLVLLIAIFLVVIFGFASRFSWPRLMFPNGQLAEENEGKDRMLTGDDPEPGVLVQEEEGSDTHPKKSEAFDIEFSFRIRISPRKRNRP